jgi:hypothetical protein
MTGPRNLEDRLTAALRAEADGVQPAGDSLDAIRVRSRAAHRRRRAAAAAAGLVAVVAVAMAVPALDDEGSQVRTGDDPRPSTSAEVPGVTSTLPDDTAPSETAPGETAPGGTAPGGPAEPAFDLEGQPLWPFRSRAEADEWLATAAEGHAPWHADAEATAVFFTTGYLGFTGLDLVTSSDVGATEAWVGVGYEAEPGVRSTAAVIHLVRYGPDPQAPWEVVGTRDSVLTLDTPGYGAEVDTTVTAGGTVTGVDESLRLEVRQPSSSGVLGEWCCQPAGGEGARWSASVSYDGAVDPVLTLVVSTGGHVRDVEIFAVTALRP